MKELDYQLPLKCRTKRIFNFEGNYYQCTLLDSKNNIVVSLCTEYESRRNSFKKAGRKLAKYLSKNSGEFPRILKNIRRSKKADHLEKIADNLK
jgi:hypothetical protein